MKQASWHCPHANNPWPAGASNANAGDYPPIKNADAPLPNPWAPHEGASAEIDKIKKTKLLILTSVDRTCFE